MYISYLYKQVTEVMSPVPEMEVEEEVDIEFEEELDRVPFIRRRRNSERITLNKLKRAVYDADGGGSSIDKSIGLD